MSKYEIEVEITGFKLRVKGDRPQDYGVIQSELGKQLMSAVQPSPQLLGEPPRKHIDSTSHPINTAAPATSRTKATRKAKTSKAPVEPISWQHDPAKWGMPTMSWLIGSKLVWLLYVVKQETGRSQLSAADMIRTWNDKFKQFGPLKRGSMTQATKGLKTAQPALALDDTTKTPTEWYLTEEGVKTAERIIQDALTPATQSA